MASAASRMAVGQRLQQRVALFQQRQRGAARRTRAQAGQLGEQLDQPLDFGTDGGHYNLSCPASVSASRHRAGENENVSHSRLYRHGGRISSCATSRTATISAPGKRSSTARTIGSCITLQSAPPWRSSSARPGWARRPRWRWRRSSARRSSRAASVCRSLASVRGARGWGGIRSAPAPAAPDAYRSRYSRAVPIAARTKRQRLPNCGWRRSERLWAWIAALGASQPPPPPRVLTRACPRRQAQGKMGAARMDYRADPSPACRWAAVRRHRPAGSAPSRRPRSAGWRRAPRTGP